MSIHTKSLLVGASTLASVLAVQQASADSSLETVTEPVEKVQIPENLPQGDPLPDIVENGLAPKLKGSQSILNKPTVTGSDLRNVRGDGSDLRKINVTGAVRGNMVFIRTEFANGMVQSGTGIVVGNNTILTVAHNFINASKTNEVFKDVVKMTITIGSNSEIQTKEMPDTTQANFNHTTSGTEITIDKADFDFFNLDKYQSHVNSKNNGEDYKWKYDITMIKLKTPFNAVAEKLNLGTGKALQLGDPLEWKKMHPDYQARTIGYPGNPGTGEDKLFRELPVKGMLYENTGQNISLISPDDRSAYFWQWPGTQIHGMSGGALVNQQNQLVGLVQFGTDGHNKDGGGLLFTDTYQNWIKQVLKKNSLTGFHTIDGKKYYYDENGNPVINDKKVIGDTEYTFNAYGSVTNERDVTAERLAREKAEAEAKAEQARKEAEAKAKAEEEARKAEEAKAEQARKETEAKAKAEEEAKEAAAKAERQRQVDEYNAQLEAKLQQQRLDAEAKEKANREAEKAQAVVSDAQPDTPAVVAPKQPAVTAGEAQAASDTAQLKWDAYRKQQAREAQVVREYEVMKQGGSKQESTVPTSTVDASTLNEKDAQASSERVNQLLADLHNTSNSIREQLGNTHAREVGRQYGNSVKSNLEGIRAGKSLDAVRQDLRQHLNQVADTLHTSRPDDKAIDDAVRQLEDEANRIHTTPKQDAPTAPAQRIYTPNTTTNGVTSNTQAPSNGVAPNTQVPSNGTTSTAPSNGVTTSSESVASQDTAPQSTNSNTSSQVTTTDTSADTAKKLPPTTTAKELPKTGDTSVVALFGLLSLLGGYGVLPKKRS